MSRVMVVVLGMGVLVWGLAFLDFDRPRVRGGAVAEDEPSAPAAGSEVVARAPAGRPRPAVERPAATAPPSEAAPLARPAVSPGKVEMNFARHSREAPASATAPGPRSTRQGALSTVTGELGEGSLSPEYAEMERSYAHEPRDGAWAEGEERRLRDLLARSTLASQVGIVNCQETLCRVLLESDDGDVYARLLAVPGWTELTGLGPGSPYSHRSGQLSVYFTRRGSGQTAR